MATDRDLGKTLLQIMPYVVLAPGDPRQPERRQFAVPEGRRIRRKALDNFGINVVTYSRDTNIAIDTLRPPSNVYVPTPEEID